MTAHAFRLPAHAVADCPNTPGDCPVCDAEPGDDFCTVCEGSSDQSTLTTECAGRALNRAERHLIAEGKLDFVDDKWIDGYAKAVAQETPETKPPVSYSTEERIAIYRAAASILTTIGISDEVQTLDQLDEQMQYATELALILHRHVREATNA